MVMTGTEMMIARAPEKPEGTAVARKRIIF